MNTQLNIRLSKNMLEIAQDYSDKFGYSNIQELVKEALREKIFGREINKTKLETLQKRATEFEENIKTKRYTRKDLGF